MKRLFSLFLCGFIISVTSVQAQLTVQPSHPVSNRLEDIVQSLVGQGVIVSNITSNQPSGTDLFGTFTETSGELGIGQGLLMTSGTVQNAMGPNNSSSMSGTQFLPGDPDLSNIVRDETYDACVIEFDVMTTSTEISFNYIFASEEYPEFVNSSYNDVFAFLISGPGIVGERNIALVPATTVPVSINNVNDQKNAGYYRTNGDGVFGGGAVLQYDGLTVRLKAVAKVMPCNVYHLKLAIADVGDNQYDSGVFIESGSLSGTDALMIGSLLAPDTLTLCETSLPVSLIAGINSVPNYTWTRNGVEVATGSKYYDVLSDGWYKVRAYRDASCYWVDSIRIFVDPDFTLMINPDTGICPGGIASLNVTATGSSGYTYAWSPAVSLSASNIPNPIATPVTSTTYTVVVKAGLCTRQRSVMVQILQPVNLVVDTTVGGCINEEVQLLASGAENYIWSPATGLNDPLIANPIATLAVDQIYKVVGYNACFRDSANVTVSVYPIPPVQAYGDTVICFGGTATLSSDYFSQYQYSWTPSGSLSNALIPDPLARPVATTDYVLSAINYGCIKRDTVRVQVRDEIKAEILLGIPYGEVPWKVKLRNVTVGASDYTWYVTGFDSTKVNEPTFEIEEEGYYTVVLKAMNANGCYDYDTLLLKAYKLMIPNLITPNGDGKNDTFQITGLGDYFGLEIYNRWGDRVYKKSHYRNEWDGEGLSDGIYYFVIYDTFMNKSYKGWVQVLR